MVRASWAGQRVLVTGGAGFIGYHLCKTLIRLGAEVIAYDNLDEARAKVRAKRLADLGARIIEGDVLDRNRLLSAAEGVQAVFHLAAKSSVAESHRRPMDYCQVNVIGTLRALEAARQQDALFVFSSSSTVYGPAALPTAESHPCEPISFYGLSKLLAEECCQLYHRSYGLRTVCFRLFNVYGPEASAGVIYDFLWKLKRNHRKLEIIGSGRQSKDFVYVEDVVEALLAASLEQAAGRTYNVGSGQSMSVLRIAELIVDLLGLRGVTEIVRGTVETWPGDVQYTLADISRIERELGWKPRTPFSEGLRRTIDWFQREFGPIVR